jgi:GNAT superfamily N-acetyltransferase
MAQALTLRRARLEDVAALDDLFARSYPKLLRDDYPPSVLVTAIPLLSKSQPQLLTSGRYFVVELEGEIVGAGGWSARRPRTGRAQMRHVVTDALHQRRGVARRIVEQVISETAALGFAGLDCQSTRNAVPFYQAMGFVPLGAVEVPLAPGITFPAVQMHRGL